MNLPDGVFEQAQCILGEGYFAKSDIFNKLLNAESLWWFLKKEFDSLDALSNGNPTWSYVYAGVSGWRGVVQMIMLFVAHKGEYELPEKHPEKVKKHRRAISKKIEQLISLINGRNSAYLGKDELLSGISLYTLIKMCPSGGDLVKSFEQSDAISLVMSDIKLLTILETISGRIKSEEPLSRDDHFLNDMPFVKTALKGMQARHFERALAQELIDIYGYASLRVVLKLARLAFERNTGDRDTISLMHDRLEEILDHKKLSQSTFRETLDF